MHRDILLDQEIVWIKKQHKRELGNHEISINLVRDVQRHHQESRLAQNGEIAVLKALVEQLMGQVKGKGKVSDPTPGASGAGGGIPPPLPPHGAAGAPGRGGGGDPDDEGEETPMMREKDLEGSQMRVGKEDGTRDPHPSQKKTTMKPKTMNSLTCSHGSGPMPWDNERESQRNPLPCFETKTPRYTYVAINMCGLFWSKQLAMGK